MAYQITIYSAEEREAKRQELARRNGRSLERLARAGRLCQYQPAKEGRWSSQEEQIVVRVMRPEGNLVTNEEWHETLLWAFNNLDLPTADKRRLIESGKVWKDRARCQLQLNQREKAYLLRHLA